MLANMRFINRKIILMYGLFLGWGEILIGQIFSDNSLDILKIFLIFAPLLLVVFFVFKRKKIRLERLYILETAAVCIALMAIYFFLYHVLPKPIKYVVVIILLSSLVFMTLSMFASFRLICTEVMTVTDAIRIAAAILFVNTFTVLLHQMIAHYNMQLLDAAILFLILCAYFLCFFKPEDTKKVYVSKSETKTPPKTLLLVAVMMFLLSIGYGPFLNSLKNMIINTYPYAFIYLRVVYLLSLAATYFLIGRIKEHLEILAMFLLAGIVVAHLFVSIFNNTNASVILTIIIQLFYPALHAVLGGLLIMLAYSFRDTYHNSFILTTTAIISLLFGVLLPAFLVGRAFLNILCTIIFSVVAMVITVFARSLVFNELSKATDMLKDEKRRTDNLNKISFYETLTPREKEILEYLISDYTNKDISGMLAISENTLKKHSKNIYAKLKIKNKNELKKIVKMEYSEHAGFPSAPG